MLLGNGVGISVGVAVGVGVGVTVGVGVCVGVGVKEGLNNALVGRNADEELLAEATIRGTVKKATTLKQTRITAVSDMTNHPCVFFRGWTGIGFCLSGRMAGGIIGLDV